MKTPEPNAGQTSNKNRAAVLDSIEKAEDHSLLFQYTPSNYYDASGGGGTGATTRYYRDLYLKQMNQRADSSTEHKHLDTGSAEEEDTSERNNV